MLIANRTNKTRTWEFHYTTRRDGGYYGATEVRVMVDAGPDSRKRALTALKKHLAALHERDRRYVFTILTDEQVEIERAVTLAERRVEEGQARWAETGSTRRR